MKKVAVLSEFYQEHKDNELQNSFEYINLLKQKPPFLMIDQILSFTAGRDIQGYKTFSRSDFPGFFSKTNLPLFILVETMGQLSEVLIRATFGKYEGYGILVAVNELTVLKNTRMGQTLFIKSRLDNVFNGMYRTKAIVHAQNIKIAEALLVHTFK